MRKEIEVNGGDVLSLTNKVIKKDVCYKRMFELDNILIEQYINTKGNIVKKYCTIIENDKYYKACLLYTSDAADEQRGVDLGGRRIIKKDRAGFFQAEDGIRDLVRSRGLGDVYKRQQ